jgi:hypothetical protein
MGKYQQKNVWLFVHAMTMRAPPKQALRLVRPSFANRYLVKAILGNA